MITKITDNKLMESFYNMMPYFKYYFGEEVGFTMSNTETFLLVQNTDKLKINFQAGDKIPQGSAADICLKKQDVVDTIIPKEVFGFPVKTVAIPVFEDNKIAGTVVVSISIDKINKISKISSLSSSVSEALTEINSNVKEMASGFQKINETNENIESSLETTKENYKKTDEIFNFVSNVTKKTNLLGLNASIEAARAGEAGLGFAVVASQITNLADSTKNSLTEINTVLGSIQESIADIYSRFQSSNTLLENQIKGLNNIESAIETITENVKVLNEVAKTL